MAWVCHRYSPREVRRGEAELSDFGKAVHWKGYTEASDGWWAHSGGEWLHNKNEMAYFHLPTGQIRVVLDDSAELPARFNEKKGFGFIEPIDDAAKVLDKDRVLSCQTDDGRMCAVRVKVAQEAADGGVVEVQGVWRCVLPQKKRLTSKIAGLAVSRSFGDKDFKGGPDIVSAEPEITVHEVDWDADEFVILATDGIWDVLSDRDSEASYVDAVEASIKVGGCTASRASIAGACYGSIGTDAEIPADWLASCAEGSRIKELAEKLVSMRKS
eukprot:Skav221797  [mRNA]  locus=scaffold4067:203458:214393:- [translate_table: standard]